MPIHWRSQTDIDEENRYGRVSSPAERAALRREHWRKREVSYEPPEHLKLPADELLIRLRKVLEPLREEDLQHDADLERDGVAEK